MFWVFRFLLVEDLGRWLERLIDPRFVLDSLILVGFLHISVESMVSFF